MKERLPLLAGTMALSLFLASPLHSQDTPCPAGATVTGYRCDPIPTAYSDILPIAGVTNVFGFGVDDSTTFVPFPGGFAFTYYGVAKTQVGICSNGWATFTTTTSASATNRHPEDGTTPNDVIFPWHDDLVLTGPASSVDYLFDLTPGLETMTIQWSHVENFVASGPPLVGRGSFSFQCVLYASTHTLLPDRIEYRYDHTTSPPVMSPCQTTNPGTLATSATIGCEMNQATSSLNVGGAEATDRGAANEVFPDCDIRLTQVTYTSAGTSATTSLVMQEPFCHIEGLPGTLMVPPSCVAGACSDDTNSTATMGVAIPLPWKFNLNGRIMKSAVMNSNGFLALSRGSSFADFSNGVLPGTADPDGLVAAFWDDLEAGGTSGMFYRVDGLPGCRVMTFEWHEFGPWASPGGDCVTAPGSVTMQVKLYEGSAGSLASSTPLCPYDIVVPGNGNDRIEIHYDHAAFVPGAFTATIGVENHKGTIAASCLPGSANAAPPAGMKCVIDPCDYGQVRYYGDPSTVPGAALPGAELKANCVPPVIGNPFALEIVGPPPLTGALPLSVLLLDVGGPLPGLRTPVPCGGIPTPFGTLWVNLFSSLHLVKPGCCVTFNLPIPNNPILIGGTIFAQGACFTLTPIGFVPVLTEGAKIVIG